MRRSMSGLLLLLLALFLTMTGCTRLPTEAGAAATEPAALPSPTMVGGHQLGPVIDCSTTCKDVLSFAETSAISTLSLDPVAIMNHVVYAPFIPAGMTSSGGGYVVVYDLNDGSQLAIRVHCGVGDCQVVPPQPIDLGPPVDYSCNGSVCIRCEGSICSPWVPPSPEES